MSIRINLDTALNKVLSFSSIPSGRGAEFHIVGSGSNILFVHVSFVSYRKKLDVDDSGYYQSIRMSTAANLFEGGIYQTSSMYRQSYSIPIVAYISTNCCTLYMRIWISIGYLLVCRLKSPR